MGSFCRECEFEMMSDVISCGKGWPFRDFPHYPWWDYCRHYRRHFHHGEWIIVYLEDYVKDEKSGYILFLDFLSISDYEIFRDSEIVPDLYSYGDYMSSYSEGDNDRLPSTFILISNYRDSDSLVKGAHYYLNIPELRRHAVVNHNNEKDDAKEEFPFLAQITLNYDFQDNPAETLLYYAGHISYPQWVFHDLHKTHSISSPPNNDRLNLVVHDVGQGNFNEITHNELPYIIFDAGTEIPQGTFPYHNLFINFQSELKKRRLPLLVVSHWHTDHYSLLLRLSQNDLKQIDYCIFPSVVNNLSVFSFIIKIHLLGIKLTMVKHPISKRSISFGLNNNTKLYIHRYVKSNPNNSGVSLFFQGKDNNVTLPGDCYYTIAEEDTKNAIVSRMSSGIHYLVIPHHGGKAGKVSYKIPYAPYKEGIISVGKNNSYGHPINAILLQLSSFLGVIDLTMNSGTIKRPL